MPMHAVDKIYPAIFATQVSVSQVSRRTSLRPLESRPCSRHALGPIMSGHGMPIRSAARTWHGRWSVSSYQDLDTSRLSSRSSCAQAASVGRSPLLQVQMIALNRARFRHLMPAIVMAGSRWRRRGGAADRRRSRQDRTSAPSAPATVASWCRNMWCRSKRLTDSDASGGTLFRRPSPLEARGVVYSSVGCIPRYTAG